MQGAITLLPSRNQSVAAGLNTQEFSKGGCMPAHIAIIGTGPTGVYTFKHLVEAGGVGAITLFEKAREAGVGMPYCPEMAARTMLANIASIEIPPIEMSYLSFLKTLPQAFLRSYGVDPLALDDREFTPRLLLGRF
jgi:uncharacterized NAD(P)/FAD-binding protein YdhS